MKKFDELYCWLQKDNPSDVKMSKVRFYFDKLITEYPAVRSYLGKDSNLVHSPDFDNAIVKIQLALDQGKSTVALSPAEFYRRRKKRVREQSPEADASLQSLRSIYHRRLISLTMYCYMTILQYAIYY